MKLRHQLKIKKNVAIVANNYVCHENESYVDYANIEIITDHEEDDIQGVIEWTKRQKCKSFTGTGGNRKEK